MSDNISKKPDKERSVFDRLGSIENLLEDFAKQQPVPHMDALSRRHSNKRNDI